MLSLRRVTRTYRAEGPARRALDDVTLDVKQGARVALVGDNGAGKSTLLRIAAMLDAPTSGTVVVAGHDAATDGRKARARIGYVGQEPGLYDALTVRENLAFVARFHGRERDVEDAARRMGVARLLDARAGALSRGERQRAAIARGLLQGELLLLDEPTTALDANGRELALEALAAQAGRTLVIATHDARVIETCDRIVRLDAGRVVEVDA